MIDELNAAIEAYFTKWNSLIASTGHKTFFDSLKPTAIGWKVEGLAEFDQRFMVLREQADQIHIGWINDRWIACLHLKDSKLAQGIIVIKIMQRRPESADAVGLDHVDFFIPPTADARAVLGAEAPLQWTEEMNGDHCKWISVWFAGTEAKLRTDTVLKVCADEMLACEAKLIGS